MVQAQPVFPEVAFQVPGKGFHMRKPYLLHTWKQVRWKRSETQSGREERGVVIGFFSTWCRQRQCMLAKEAVGWGQKESKFSILCCILNRCKIKDLPTKSSKVTKSFLQLSPWHFSLRWQQAGLSFSHTSPNGGVARGARRSNAPRHWGGGSRQHRPLSW